MLTVLLLVSLTATIVLMLAIAADEARRVSQSLLSHWGVFGGFRSSLGSEAFGHEHSVRVGSEAGVHPFTPRPRAAVRNPQHEKVDRIPDRAA